MTILISTTVVKIHINTLHLFCLLYLLVPASGTPVAAYIPCSPEGNELDDGGEDENMQNDEGNDSDRVGVLVPEDGEHFENYFYY